MVNKHPGDLFTGTGNMMVGVDNLPSSLAALVVNDYRRTVDRIAPCVLVAECKNIQSIHGKWMLCVAGLAEEIKE